MWRPGSNATSGPTLVQVSSLIPGRCTRMHEAGEPSEPRSEEIASLLREQIGASFRILGPIDARGPQLLLRARDLEHDEDVVIRVLPLDGAVPPGALPAFEREVAIASSLVHPNIVSVGSLQRCERLAFCIERERGAPSLESKLREGESFGIDRSLALLHEIAAALDYAHAHDVVHGTLVPELIFLPDDASLRVTGFGEGEALGRLHRRESAAYMPPEQWQDHARADRRADIYALAVIACELFGRRRRIVTTTTGGVISVETLPLTQFAPLRPKLGLHVNAAILRATAKRTERPFATAREFVTALESIHDKPVSSAPHQHPSLGVAPSRSIAMLPMAIVAMLGISVGVLLVPFVRHLMNSPSSVSSIAEGLDDVPSAPTSSESVRPSSSAPTTDVASSGETTDGGSGTTSIFSGAPHAAGSRNDARSAAVVPIPAMSVPPTANGSVASTVRVGDAPEGSSGGTSSPSMIRTPGYGIVRVEFDGGPATVLIDGNPLGNVPYAGRVSAGDHMIMLVGGGLMKPRTRRISIANGDTTLAAFSVTPP